MNTEEATALVRRCLHEVAPDANPASLGPADDIRETLYLDSLDFLQFVELLSERGGVRVDEEDYPRIATVAGAIELLTGAVLPSGGTAA